MKAIQFAVRACVLGILAFTTAANAAKVPAKPAAPPAPSSNAASPAEATKPPPAAKPAKAAKKGTAKAAEPAKQETSNTTSHLGGFPNLTGRFGAGISSNFLYFGLGPIGEYWFAPNLAAIASVGIVGDISSYSLGGMYLFDKTFQLFRNPAKPYVSASFSSVTEGYGGGDLDGTGFELSGGIFQVGPIPRVPNLGFAAEFSFSTVKLENDYVDCNSGTCYGYHAESDYGGFSIGAKAIYYFDK